MRWIHLVLLPAILLTAEPQPLEKLIENEVIEFAKKQSDRMGNIKKVRIFDSQIQDSPEYRRGEKSLVQETNLESKNEWSSIINHIKINQSGTLTLLIQINSISEISKTVLIGFENKMSDGGIVLWVSKINNGFELTRKASPLPD